MLSLLGRLAHGVNETNFRFRKAVTQNANQVAHFFDWLRRLRRNAKPRAFVKLEDIRHGKDNVEIRQILGQAANFDMLAFPDDHRMKTITNESCYCSMSNMDQWARGFHYLKALVSDMRYRCFGSAMGR